MNIAIVRQSLTEQEYLEGELLSNIRHEYIDGAVYAMVGAHRHHNLISVNLLTKFANHLEGKPCKPYTSDMKVKVGSKYFYPDVMVDCSKDEYDYYTENPTIIVEVLSKSTRQHDKTFKREAYFQIASLKEYVLIEQDFVEVELWYRGLDQHWQQKVYYLGDDITFDSIGLTVSVEDIYQRVKNEDMLAWLEKKVQIETADIQTNDQLIR